MSTTTTLCRRMRTRRLAVGALPPNAARRRSSSSETRLQHAVSCCMPRSSMHHSGFIFLMLGGFGGILQSFLDQELEKIVTFLMDHSQMAAMFSEVFFSWSCSPAPREIGRGRRADHSTNVFFILFHKVGKTVYPPPTARHPQVRAFAPFLTLQPIRIERCATITIEWGLHCSPLKSIHFPAQFEEKPNSSSCRGAKSIALVRKV
jgi:hypothetical protein